MKSLCLAVSMCLVGLLLGGLGLQGAALVTAAAPSGTATFPKGPRTATPAPSSASAPTTVVATEQPECAAATAPLRKQGTTAGEAQPTRIEFQPGAASATLTCQMDAAGTDRYVLEAAQGQTMWVSVTASEGAAILVIWGADGAVLISDHADATSWNGDLPLTQDYSIDVKGSPDSATTYTLLMVIPPKTTGHITQIDGRAASSTVELNVGDQLAVMLKGNPTTGYLWETHAVDGAVLQPVGEADFSPDSEAMGAGGQVTLHFIALSPGQTTLQLVYHRSWEKDTPPAQTFEVDVTVK